MNEEPKQTLSVRDLLIQRGFDPALEAIELVQSLKEDKEEIRDRIEGIDSDFLKTQMSISALDIDKTRLKVLKFLNDAKQKEDDQRLKLQEMSSKGELSGATIEYVIPAYSKEVGADGKIRMVRLIGDGAPNE